MIFIYLQKFLLFGLFAVFFGRNTLITLKTSAKMRIIVKTALNRDRFERHRSMRYAVICNFKPINQYIFLRRNAEFPFEHSIQSASLETELLAYFGYRKVAVIVAVNIFDHFV
mgnify:FL=1